LACEDLCTHTFVFLWHPRPFVRHDRSANAPSTLQHASGTRLVSRLRSLWRQGSPPQELPDSGS
jgi:hypothetical protein